MKNICSKEHKTKSNSAAAQLAAWVQLISCHTRVGSCLIVFYREHFVSLNQTNSNMYLGKPGIGLYNLLIRDRSHIRSADKGGVEFGKCG